MILNDREKTIEELEKAVLDIKMDLLKLATKEVIHIGGDLSIVDVITALWQCQMRYDPNNPQWEGRDRFILSKGHASAVTAFNQAAIGCFERDEIMETYAKDESRFSMHACSLINPYNDFSTGSLGHGLPVALGMAAGLKLKGNLISRVYVIMGDGEQTEGSVWEAAMNAVFHKLGNLVVFVDGNDLAGDGPLCESSSIGDIGDKYKTFGWRVEELDGHNMQEIKEKLITLPPADSDVPTVFICHTVKGHSVPFMENNPKWHCGKITEEQYKELSEKLQREFEERWRGRCV